MEPTPAPGLLTCSITMSVDGFVAGPGTAALTLAGAYIMGRNMFGPGRGGWDMAGALPGEAVVTNRQAQFRERAAGTGPEARSRASKASRPSLTSATTSRPGVIWPARSIRESWLSTSRWMVRRIGRAPNSGW